jgi:uncharacterized protein (DUF3084 family)
VLEEMRAADKKRNYSYLGALIEEIQVLANRMEAALGEKRDLENLHEEVKKIDANLKTLKKEQKDLKNQIKGLKIQRSKLIKDIKKIKHENPTEKIE